MRDVAAKFIWKLKVPPTVRLFVCLLCHGKLLTQGQLLKRKINFAPGCSLCQQMVLETATHLFCHCHFTHTMWEHTANVFGLRSMRFTDDIMGLWLVNRNPTRGGTGTGFFW